MRKIFSYLCFFFLLIQSFYVEATKIIPLGAACGAAMYLREAKLRQAAYPFDWVICAHEGLIKAIDEDFAHFLENLTVWNNQGVIDYYGFQFTHDWPNIKNKIVMDDADFIGSDQLIPEWQQALPKVKEKYRRRIERFIKACSDSEPIIFLRSEYVNRGQAIEIRDLIRKKFPQLDFLLVVVADDKNFIEPWNIEGIHNYNRYSDATIFLKQSVEKGYIIR